TEKNQRPEMQPTLHRLGHLAAEMGTTLDALALGVALQQPWATVVLSGAVSVSQLNSNLTALSLDWDRALDEELNQFVEPAGVYWTRRSQLPWN
ncbi:MAG: aldo/keto reductase, partial [Anaerolineales bacterium]|nr:aldo/keto reductase [Anaerolineales bacterium]